MVLFWSDKQAAVDWTGGAWLWSLLADTEQQEQSHLMREQKAAAKDDHRECLGVE